MHSVEGHLIRYPKLLLMGREGLYREVKLSSLSRMMFGESLKHVGRIGAFDLWRKVGSDTMGNPLFVVESLRMLHQRGNLSKTNGQWGLCVDEL